MSEPSLRVACCIFMRADTAAACCQLLHWLQLCVPAAAHCPALLNAFSQFHAAHPAFLLAPGLSPLPRRSAPELLMGQRCTAKADVYSFGVVLWEIATGEVPIRGQLRDPM